MEFGRVPLEQLPAIDFSLPPDPEENAPVLASVKNNTPFRFYFGTTKWTFPEWVGTWYPKGTKSARFLEAYAQQFNSIELNTTFYRMPTFRQTSDWQSKVSDDFRFCPKFVDQITHIRRLKNTEAFVHDFVDGISGFGKKLGPILLMPHPAMGPHQLDTIAHFVESLPPGMRVALELRHTEWFTDTSSFRQLCSILEKHQQATCITDTAGRRDCVHMRLTSATAMIRFVGNDLHPTDYTRIDQWIDRICQWKEKGLQEIYFFLHEPDESLVPELAHHLIEQINSRLGITVRLPQLHAAPGLFG
ncbi:MAG: DUF72 domain-containing protein [Cyclobacteriaceae bacterium]|jgi:uncharacterized protein YecE (DUF72 family)|nr:DUF72 domain-containing protein [Cyclobacteriaceae bacterium]